MTDKSTDIEKAKNPKEHLEGFADFSHYISSDETLSIYRHFETLAARNILYLQAELQALEGQLNDLDDDDDDNTCLSITGGVNEKEAVEDAARMWEAFKYLAEEGNERQAKKMKIVLRIRELMPLYEKAVLRRSQILALGNPRSSTLNAFTNWFRTRMPFRGRSCYLLEDENDLVSLYTEPESDRLSAFIHKYFSYALKPPNEGMPKSWKGMYYYPKERVA